MRPIRYSECMQIEALDFRHKELLVPRLKAIPVALSEYTFANLYLFREKHNYEVLLNRALFIRGRSYDGRTYLMPTQDVRGMDLQSIRDLLAGVDFLFPIPEEWLSVFPSREFEVTFFRGDEDYLYSTEKMSTYKGRDLHKKRNLLKQFVTLYRHEALPLTNDRLGDARSILRDWMTSSEMNPAETDYAPCLEALDRYEDLGLCGGIFHAEGEPAGFMLGEEIGPETFVLHFAKARTDFKGVYQYMFNSFAKVLPPKYRYVNLEQDLDRENLRVFKNSYVPDLMLKKARVSLKKGL